MTLGVGVNHVHGHSWVTVCAEFQGCEGDSSMWGWGGGAGAVWHAVWVWIMCGGDCRQVAGYLGDESCMG